MYNPIVLYNKYFSCCRYVFFINHEKYREKYRTLYLES